MAKEKEENNNAEPSNENKGSTKDKKKDDKKKASSNELKGIGIFGKLVGIVIIIWLISISYYAFAFFILGMLPSILTSIVDRGAGKFASKTVTACNFSAIIPYIFDIGLTYEKDLYAKQLMSDFMTWIIIYSFAAIGWLIIWIFPNLTLIYITARADMQVKALEAEQKKILEDWGEEVKTGKPRVVTLKEDQLEA